jgi:hypothetical protein
MKQSTVIVEWKGPDGWVNCTFHDVDVDEAIDKAKVFGYVEPKSYEFWKRKADIYTYE